MFLNDCKWIESVIQYNWIVDIYFMKKERVNMSKHIKRFKFFLSNNRVM